MDKTFAINHDEVSAGYAHCKVILDNKGNPVDCLYLSVNNAYGNILGKEKDELLNKSVAEVHLPPNDKTLDCFKKLVKVALTGKGLEFEFFSTNLNKWMTVFAFSNQYLYVSAFCNMKANNNALQQELGRANHINSLLLDSIPHPALLIKKDCTVIAANKMAKEWGTIVDGFCWKDWGKFLYLSEQDLKRADSYTSDEGELIRCFFCKENEALEINQPTNIKIKLGDIFWDVFWIPTQEEGVYLHYAIDITEAKAKEREIEHLSYYDNLTGLYNRAYFEKELKEINETTKLPVSIIIGDINGLRMVNDLFGHHEGDKLLQKTAQTLKESCRTKDILARYGGDEFALILPETSHDSALCICNGIRQACCDKQQLIPANISLGFATKETIEESIYKTLKTAEDMMYKHKLLESKSIRNSILASLEVSLHEKDIETREHALRLVETTAKVGNALGLTQYEMDELNLFARLHDIGKITVDERILNKQERLTDAEFEQIKRHSEAGYRIVKSSQDLLNIAEYILAHHERWDGEGYPHGLKGEEIPLLSRVLSIADAYDAMTNERPYRKAMSKDEAIKELESCSGKQFDPTLVPIFISVIDH